MHTHHTHVHTYTHSITHAYTLTHNITHAYTHSHNITHAYTHTYNFAHAYTHTHTQYTHQLGSAVAEEATPLLTASAAARGEVCLCLIDAAADVNAADRRGTTPLLWATRVVNVVVTRLPGVGTVASDFRQISAFRFSISDFVK